MNGLDELSIQGSTLVLRECDLPRIAAAQVINCTPSNMVAICGHKPACELNLAGCSHRRLLGAKKRLAKMGPLFAIRCALIGEFYDKDH